MTVDELSEYGMQRMSDEEVENHLSTHSLGILGLPTEGAPYLLPMSYGYDGGSRLYFYYVMGPRSRKDELSDRAETASFLVYSAETLFIWRSALLTGTLHTLSSEQRGKLTEAEMPRWRPKLFETASEKAGSQIHEFRIEEWTGVKQNDLPPGFFGRGNRDRAE